jgi:hypothetical protein
MAIQSINCCIFSTGPTKNILMNISFAREAKCRFDPLAKKFGLSFVTSNEREVRYESKEVLLKVNFDNGRSFELDVEIGKKDGRYPGPPFSLQEILKLRKSEEAGSIYSFLASNEEKFKKILDQLANLTVKYAADFLMNGEFSFMQIEKFRNRESIEFELAAQLSYARSLAMEAWSARDYASIIRELGPIEAHLNPEDKKLLKSSREELSL